MKLKQIVDWLNSTLKVNAFDDVSNNGLQIDRESETISTVAVAVDASLKSVRAAVAAGVELLIVHHGLSWGGGIRYLTEGVGKVVRAAMKNDLALYACHLPLDAHPRLGNNYNLARSLKLKSLKPAFNYHGNIIGVIGEAAEGREYPTREGRLWVPKGARVGVCSGGAGSFAADALKLGCDLYVTGEADWGEVIAAENVEMPMACFGHYETEVFGVSALAKAMSRELKLKVVNLTEEKQ